MSTTDRISLHSFNITSYLATTGMFHNIEMIIEMYFLIKQSPKTLIHDFEDYIKQIKQTNNKNDENMNDNMDDNKDDINDNDDEMKYISKQIKTKRKHLQQVRGSQRIQQTKFVLSVYQEPRWV